MWLKDRQVILHTDGAKILHTDGAKACKLALSGVIHDNVVHKKKWLVVNGKQTWVWPHYIHEALHAHLAEEIRVKAGTQVIDRFWGHVRAYLKHAARLVGSCTLRRKIRGAAQWTYWHRGENHWRATAKMLQDLSLFWGESTRMKKKVYHIVILLQHTLPMVRAHMWLTCSPMFKPNVAHGIFCFHAWIRLIIATHQLCAIVLLLCLLSTSQTFKLLSSTHVIFCFNANASDSMRPLTSVQSCCGYFLKAEFHLTQLLSWFTRAPLLFADWWIIFGFHILICRFRLFIPQLDCAAWSILHGTFLCPMAAAESPPLRFEDDYCECLDCRNPTGMNQCYFHSARITSHLLLRSTWILPLPSDPGWWERRPWERRPPDEVPFHERERSRSPRRAPLRVPVTPPELLEPHHAHRKVIKCNGKARLNLLL